MVARQPARFTPEQYFAFEESAEWKHEYERGEIYAMTGASIRHVLIVTNLVGELRAQLRGKPCTVYSSDLRLFVEDAIGFFYPDVMVICGEAQFYPKRNDTITNPTLVIEVLSPSTAAYDRTEKFARYRTLPSLQEYLLIAQDKPHIEHYIRQPDGKWLYEVIEGLAATVHLSSIACDLPITEVYDKVTWQESG